MGYDITYESSHWLILFEREHFHSMRGYNQRNEFSVKVYLDLRLNK